MDKGKERRWKKGNDAKVEQEQEIRQKGRTRDKKWWDMKWEKKTGDERQDGKGRQENRTGKESKGKERKHLKLQDKRRGGEGDRKKKKRCKAEREKRKRHRFSRLARRQTVLWVSADNGVITLTWRSLCHLYGCDTERPQITLQREKHETFTSSQRVTDSTLSGDRRANRCTC